MSCNYWNAAGTEVPAMDSMEATEKLKAIQKVLLSFKSKFLETQDRSQGVWKIYPKAPFVHLDAFLARCQELHDIKLAIVQYNKLERVEIGSSEASCFALICKRMF